MAYARAISDSRADINQCPPGGKETINGLALLLDLPGKPLDPAFGRHQPKALALIDEERCIGCTLCIQACPVDAIVGGAKLMHTIIANDCTGCELCVAPCPVDCISLPPAPIQNSEQQWRWAAYSPVQVNRARQQTRLRIERQRKLDRNKSLRGKHRNMKQAGSHLRIKREIEAAVVRSRSRRAT